ncbi:hypothetical protein B0H21DRAFT_709640 [Amylocystis lapponica]|nr:hypothetical protein B0H21DRAFT_709640 [Amylocystis lapponica]
MGGASSKATRQFPKTATKPSWAGARTPAPEAGHPPPKPPFPRASETKTDAIERDAHDPQFMARLGQLGPVQVEHHMRTIQPATNRTQRAFEARAQAEHDAQSAHPPPNRLLAAALADLLEARKAVATRAGLEALAQQYAVDVARLEGVARFVNSPSVAEDSVVRTVGEDGEERVTMQAVWVEPGVQEERRGLAAPGG